MWRPALPLLMVLASACADPVARVHEGRTALAAGRYRQAATLLDEAVLQLPRGHTEALHARVDLCVALAHFDPERSVRAFERLLPLPELTEDQLLRLASELISEDAAPEAYGVIQQHAERWGGSEGLLWTEARTRAASRPITGFVCTGV